MTTKSAFDVETEAEVETEETEGPDRRKLPAAKKPAVKADADGATPQAAPARGAAVWRAA